MTASFETVRAEPSAVSAEWDELAERLAAAPFLRRGWTEAWWRAFGKGRLEIHAVRRAGRLAALVPLVRRGGVLASPTNWHSVEFGLLSESPEATGALLAALRADPARRLSLGFLDPELAGQVESEARARGQRVIRRTMQRSPYLTLAGDWETYFRGLGKNLRGDVGRRQRLLAARGTVSLEVTCAEGLEERLAQGFALEASGWKGQGGTAVQSDAAVRRFYEEIARWAAEHGWLRLAFLRLDGAPLAFDYSLEQAGVHWMLKTGFDAAQRELSPGKVLRREVLARAFQDGLASYEMLGADEPWKLQWTSTVRTRELVQVFRASALGLCDWTLFQYGRPFAKGLRDRVRGRARATSGA